jgi:hypothetical protein
LISDKSFHTTLIEEGEDNNGVTINVSPLFEDEGLLYYNDKDDDYPGQKDFEQDNQPTGAMNST